MSDWRKFSYLASERELALRYSMPRMPALPENSTALSRFLYPMIHLPLIKFRSRYQQYQPDTTSREGRQNMR